MPSNNSQKRKDERKKKAEARLTQQTVRHCGHNHTDNGFKNCNYIVEK